MLIISNTTTAYKKRRGFYEFKKLFLQVWEIHSDIFLCNTADGSLWSAAGAASITRMLPDGLNSAERQHECVDGDEFCYYIGYQILMKTPWITKVDVTMTFQSSSLIAGRQACIWMTTCLFKRRYTFAGLSLVVLKSDEMELMEIFVIVIVFKVKAGT